MEVLLADDHRLVRDGLRPFLSQLGQDTIIVEASSLGEALERVKSGIPDLVILDLFMPGMNGVEGISDMRQAVPDTPVVVLSGSTTREKVIAADKAGAAGFLSKTMGGMALVNALKLILSGEKYLPSIAFNQGADGSYTPGESPIAVPFNSLTKREMEILEWLTEGATNKEIAQHLDLQEITIKLHVKKVFRKLGVSNRTKAAHFALKHGIMAPEKTTQEKLS